MATFQERLIAAMRLREVNAAELSRLSGVNEGAICQYKKGKYKANQHNIEKIAKSLNVSIPWLMGVSDVFGSYENNLSPVPQLDNILRIKEKRLPVLGDVAAGKPKKAPQHIEYYVTEDENLDADYALQVKDDSMIGAGIDDGDIVFIRKQPDVENGEMAAVYVDGEATLKRIFKDGKGISLYSENPKYPPMYFTAETCEEFRIFGKAVKKLTDIK